MKDVDTIIYHGDCPDGFCAAFVAQKVHPEARLVPATYGKTLDDAVVSGRRVLVVDFSWPREETLRLHALSESMTILDHHKTAQSALEGLDFAVFDMERSGAQLAYDYCIRDGRPVEDSGGSRPWYVDYVADRDLWLWTLPESKAVSAFIMALPHTIAAWNVLDSMNVDEAIASGKGARAHVEHYIEKVTAQAYPGKWQGYSVSIVNAAYPNISDVGNALCEQGAQVGLGWFIRGDGLMQFSLRSIGDIDVSALAKQQGGGGHKNAAGFQISAFSGAALLGAMTSDVGA